MCSGIPKGAHDISIPASRLRRGQVKESPPMAVEVDEAVRVHESKILRLVVGRTARGEGLGDESIDLLPALAGEVDQNFHCLARIADGLGREFAELGMWAQHDEDRLADDDTRPRVAVELRIE